MASWWLAIPGFGVGLAIGYLIARRPHRRSWSFTIHLGARDETGP